MRIECGNCDGHVFSVHLPPAHAKNHELFLICEGCQKIWTLAQVSRSAKGFQIVMSETLNVDVDGKLLVEVRGK